MKKYFVNQLAPTNFSLYKLNIYLFTFLLFYSSNIYSQNLSAEKIYKKINGAIVVIHAYDYNNKLSKQGSGVVINDKGYIVTNYHVLEGCERLEIVHNKKIIPYVDIIGVDVEKDILILKIANKKFPAIKIGNSRKLNVGQRVYAIGSPMGFENTISEGIISGLRTIESTGKQFIQITASISPGSSGGAVVNDNGELIGISTLTLRGGQNLNFAIPMEDVLSVNLGSYSSKDAYKDFELFARGYDSAEQGNYEEAIKYYTRYLEKYPNDEWAYNNRGVAKDHLLDHTGAIQDFNISIEINSANSYAFFGRGLTKSKLKDYRAAVQDFNKAIEINPKYTMAYLSRGMCKFFLNDELGQCLDFSKAGELGSDKAYEFIEKFCK